MALKNSRPDREFAKFKADALGDTSVRVLNGWDSTNALSIVKDYLSLDGFRYYTITEDDSYEYFLFYNASDEYIGGVKVYKNEKRAELYYPFLLVTYDPLDHFIVEPGVRLLI